MIHHNINTMIIYRNYIATIDRKAGNVHSDPNCTETFSRLLADVIFGW